MDAAESPAVGGMNMQKLYERLQYTFQNEALLREALTHASCDAGYSYERLEFLGDAVLELEVSAWLYRQHPDFREGPLSAMRTRLVQEEHLSAWARAQGLGEYLILGKGEENSGGREKDSILCDVVESILGAVYLDGGLDAARAIILHIVEFRKGDCTAALDAKSELQEFLQRKPNQNISYRLVRTEGPPHSAVFYMEVLVNGKSLGAGSGKSKKHAEQAAAREALQCLRRRER